MLDVGRGLSMGWKALMNVSALVTPCISRLVLYAFVFLEIGTIVAAPHNGMV